MTDERFYVEILQEARRVNQYSDRKDMDRWLRRKPLTGTVRNYGWRGFPQGVHSSPPPEKSGTPPPSDRITLHALPAWGAVPRKGRQLQEIQ